MAIDITVERRYNKEPREWQNLYPIMSMCHDWPVQNAIVDLQISFDGIFKTNFWYLMSPLGTQNKDVGATLQTFLTRVRL